ncbi:MAG: tetratricopeptide repeat protein, partial [Anaerolineae bacterium]|nr:tetratricopeptide repeat protein [Anaerolineae bacterium]
AAEMLYRQAIQLASQQHDQHTPGVSFAYDGLGQIYSEWNRLDEAAEYLERAIKLSDVGGLEVGSVLDRLHLALVLQYQGKTQQAGKLLSEAEKILPKVTHPFAEHVLAPLKIRLLLAQNRLIEVVQCGEKLEEEQSRDDPLIIAETTWAALARVRLVQARLHPQHEHLNEAFELLAKLVQQAKAMGRLSYLIEGLVLQAMAYQMRGDAGLATTVLEEALHLGQPEGFFRIFVNEGQPMAELFHELLLQQSPHTAYIKSLLAAIQHEAAEKKSAPLSVSPAIPSESLIEPLSDREMEVLRLVAAGSSNSQIANSLIIAQGTVKKHLSNIFGKLNAESRTQAVAHARELGLLE